MMTMHTSDAAPCAGCGTVTGAINYARGRYIRIRGFCAACYVHRRVTGQFPDLRPYAGRARNQHCLSCGFAGIAARGLCAACYNRAFDQGLHTAYPACGRVPVPFAPRQWAEQPEPWPAEYDDAVRTGAMLWTGRDGARQRHAISPAFAGRFGPAHDRRWEEACADWLRRHPAQVAVWDDPSLASFPPSEARAA